jgi:hypothetical protein
MGVAINSEAVWAHFIVCQAPEEGQEPRLRVLRDSVLTSQKLMGLSILKAMRLCGRWRKVPSKMKCRP